MHIETNKTTQSSLGVFAFLMEAGEKPEIGGVQRSGSTWARELAVRGDFLPRSQILTQQSFDRSLESALSSRGPWA